MYYHDADELTGHEEHMDHENGSHGDPRRCPHHPEVRTSSDDGMFDAPCGKCEGAMDQVDEMWDMNPDNPTRRDCLAPIGPLEFYFAPPAWFREACDGRPVLEWGF